jgi:hypothetical protein
VKYFDKGEKRMFDFDDYKRNRGIESDDDFDYNFDYDYDYGYDEEYEDSDRYYL